MRQGSSMVCELRIRGDGGGVARPEEDVPRGIPCPRDLVLMQNGDKNRPGADCVPRYNPVVKVHRVQKGRVDYHCQTGLKKTHLMMTDNLNVDDNFLSTVFKASLRTFGPLLLLLQNLHYQFHETTASFESTCISGPRGNAEASSFLAMVPSMQRPSG